MQAVKLKEIAHKRSKEIILIIIFFIKTSKKINKIKSAPTEVNAQKTQTPIVAKPTEKQEQIYAISSRNLHFYQIHYGHNAKRI